MYNYITNIQNNEYSEILSCARNWTKQQVFEQHAKGTLGQQSWMIYRTASRFLLNPFNLYRVDEIRNARRAYGVYRMIIFGKTNGAIVLPQIHWFRVLSYDQFCAYIYHIRPTSRNPSFNSSSSSSSAGDRDII